MYRKMIVAALMGVCATTMVIRTATHTPTHTQVSTMDAPDGDPIPMDDPTTSTTTPSEGEDGDVPTTTTSMDEVPTTTSTTMHVPTPTTTTTMVSTTTTEEVPPTTGTPPVEAPPSTATTSTTLPTNTPTTGGKGVEDVDVHVDPSNPLVLITVRTNNTDDPLPKGYIVTKVTKVDGGVITVRTQHPEVAPHDTSTVSSNVGYDIQEADYQSIRYN